MAKTRYTFDEGSVKRIANVVKAAERSGGRSIGPITPARVPNRGSSAGSPIVLVELEAGNFFTEGSNLPTLKLKPLWSSGDWPAGDENGKLNIANTLSAVHGAWFVGDKFMVAQIDQELTDRWTPICNGRQNFEGILNTTLTPNSGSTISIGGSIVGVTDHGYLTSNIDAGKKVMCSLKNVNPGGGYYWQVSLAKC